MKAMIWSVLKLDHFNVLVIAKKKVPDDDI